GPAKKRTERSHWPISLIGMANDTSPRTDSWLPHEEDEELEESLSDASAWLSWIREDVKVQSCAWLMASMAVHRQAVAEDSFLCLGLSGYLFEGPRFWHCLFGWFLASSLTLAWLILDLQMVFTSEQRAMRFPPWSILVFVKCPAEVGCLRSAFFPACFLLCTRV
ncbi:unnamed protein product, partial [Effrenium voratum]